MWRPMPARLPFKEPNRSARTVTKSSWRRSPSNARCLPPRREAPDHAKPDRIDPERRGLPVLAGEEDVLRRQRRFSREQHGYYLAGGEGRRHAKRSFLVRANTVAPGSGWRLREYGEMPPRAFRVGTPTLFH